LKARKVNLSAIESSSDVTRIGHQTAAVDGVRSRDEFRELLAREQAGSDRNSHEFSLLVFGEKNDVAAVRDLVHVLSRRIRQIDAIGWLDKRHIGVLLPYTALNGARILAQDLRRALTSQPSCTIYTYPGQWLPEERDGSGPRGSSSQAERRRNGHEGSRVAPQSTGAGEAPLRCSEWPGGLFANRIPIWKRAIDVVGALIGLVCLSPLLLLVAAVIKAVSPGPALLGQQRVGRHGRIFTMWKFRTMRVDAEAGVHADHFNGLITTDRPMTKLDVNRDPRIFPFGKLIRRSYVDELPQLINVLRGEMSLVGPRPCILYEARAYESWQNRRFDALPGMTGLWQVSGKNKTTFKEMMRLDIAYSRRRSFWLDIGILLKTVPAIGAEIASTVSHWKRPGKQNV
jgi:lipopolysaccharide/colanic/teichoic acid biosynthesis glycosyltransferase